MTQHSSLDARDDMLAIADAWPDLEDMLGRTGGGPGDGMPRAVHGDRTLVINEHVSQVIADVRDWTMFLVRTLMEEVWVEVRVVDLDRGAPQIRPQPWAPPVGSTTPQLLAHIARTRVGHFTAHADEMLALAFHDDVKALRGQVERAAYPDGYRTLDTRIPCDEQGDSAEGERVPCCGTYTIRPTGATADMPDLICTADRTHRIEPAEWSRGSWKLRHGLRMDRRAAEAFARGISGDAA